MNGTFLPSRTSMPSAHLLMESFGVLGLLLIVGCGSPPKKDLDVPQERTQAFPLKTPSSAGRLFVDQIYLPRAKSLDEILVDARFDGIEANKRAAWQANEMQIYRLNANQLKAFYKAVDDGSSMRRKQHSITNQTLQLETTPILEEAVSIDWAAKPNLDQTTRLPSGRTMWLADVKFRGDVPTITLTPQHHWVKSTLLPRTPAEKILDGRIFHDLKLAAQLPPNTYLVIHWKQPENEFPDAVATPPSPAVHLGTDTSNTPTEDLNTPSPPTIDPPSDIPAPLETPAPENEASPPKDLFPFKLPPALPRLGRLLLTGERAGKSLQLVLVIHSPMRTQPAADSRTPR